MQLHRQQQLRGLTVNLNSLMRALGAAAVGTGLVVAGVELGSSGVQAAQAEPEPTALYYPDGLMPEYPSSLEFPMGEGLGVNGVPVRVSHFETKDSPERVRDFYLQELARKRLLPQVQGSANSYVVSALAESGRSQIVVAIQSQKSGHTFVFPSLIPVDGPVEPQPASAGLAQELAMSPEAVGVMVVTAKDAGGARVITYHEPALSMAAATRHIRDELKRRGWSVAEYAEQVGDTGSGVVEATSGGTRARYTVSAMPAIRAGSTVVAHLSPAGQPGGN